MSDIKYVRIHGKIVPIKSSSAKKTSSKTSWNKLKKSGYVTELSDEQVAIAREKFNPTKPFSYAKGDHLKGGIAAEERTRAAYGKLSKKNGTGVK